MRTFLITAACLFHCSCAMNPGPLAGSAMADNEGNHGVDYYASIARYNPKTDVRDESWIDLDLQTMEIQLGQDRLVKARNVYQSGGHSQSFARLKLSPTGSASYPKGTIVTGLSNTDMEVRGALTEDISWDDIDDQTINIKVDYMHHDDTFENCQVGALYTVSAAQRDGCYSEIGVLYFVDPSTDEPLGESDYSYDPRHDNRNTRTLEGFSSNAANRMKPCKDCPYYDDYQLFVDYYGDTDYGNKYVLAAAYENETVSSRHSDFSSGRGNADFSLIEHKDANAAAMVNGAVCFNLFMKVVQKLEEAVQHCDPQCELETCNVHHLTSLDAAWAFYAGSLVGEEGRADGVLLYSLANTRAREFKTAGQFAHWEEGTASANLALLAEFKDAQLNLLRGDCPAAQENKRAIIDIMKIPLVQSVLYYAWIRAIDERTDPEVTERINVKGATYAGAVLPWIHAQSPADANTIYDNMRIGSDDDDFDFVRVKNALQRHYPALGVTCSAIGGILDEDGDYASQAEPCIDDDSSAVIANASNKQGPRIGLVVCLGVVAGLFFSGTNVSDVVVREESDVQEETAALFP